MPKKLSGNQPEETKSGTPDEGQENPYQGPATISSTLPVRNGESRGENDLWFTVAGQMILILCGVWGMFSVAPEAMILISAVWLGVLVAGLVFILLVANRLIKGISVSAFYLVWFAGHLLWLALCLLYFVPWLLGRA